MAKKIFFSDEYGILSACDDKNFKQRTFLNNIFEFDADSPLFCGTFLPHTNFRDIYVQNVAIFLIFLLMRRFFGMALWSFGDSHGHGSLYYYISHSEHFIIK